MSSFRTLALLALFFGQAIGCSFRPSTTTREGNWIKNLLTTSDPDVVRATVERKVGCSDDLSDMDVTIRLSTGEVSPPSAPSQLLAPPPSSADDTTGGYLVIVEGFAVAIFDASNSQVVEFVVQVPDTEALPGSDVHHTYFVDTVNGQQYLYFIYDYESTVSDGAIAVVNLSTGDIRFSNIVGVNYFRHIKTLYPDRQMAVLLGDSGLCEGDMILRYDETRIEVVFKFSVLPFEFWSLYPTAEDFFNTVTASETFMLLSNTAAPAGGESAVCTQSGSTFRIESPETYEIQEYSLVTGEMIQKYPLDTQDVHEIGNVQTPPDSPSLGICFSGDMTVDVLGKGVVDMKALQLGDHVIVEGGKYEEVYSFGHKNVDSAAEFVQITVDHPALPLELSKEHMVLVDGDRFIPASLVKVGDHLTTASGNSSMVTRLQTVRRQGVFAPFTASGTIVVNGIVASNYISHQNSEHLVIAGRATSFTYQWLSHSFNSMHRMALRLGIQGETYTKEGISNWAYLPLLSFSWALVQHDLVTAMLVLPTVALVGMASVLEFVLGHALLVVMSCLTIVLMNRRQLKA